MAPPGTPDTFKIEEIPDAFTSGMAMLIAPASAVAAPATTPPEAVSVREPVPQISGTGSGNTITAPGLAFTFTVTVAEAAQPDPPSNAFTEK